MDKTSIYNYSSAHQFLLDKLSFRKRHDGNFSVRSWAKEMGFGSHTLLVLLLQGKRPLRLKHVPLLSNGLGLGSAEKLYFQALIQYDNSDSPEGKQLCSLWLSELNPGKDFKTRELDEFLVISDWTYTAILMMTCLKGFKGTPKEIATRLKGEITTSEASAALQRLLDLKLLEKDKRGNLATTFHKLTTKDDVKNVGARKYHKSAIQKAAKALESVPLEKREFQSTSLPVTRDKIPLAKEMIRKFRSQFCKAIGVDGEGDDVFQLNIQFFQLTESPSDKHPKVDDGVAADV